MPMQQPAKNSQSPDLPADPAPTKSPRRYRVAIKWLVQLLVLIVSVVLSAPYLLRGVPIFTYLGVAPDYANLVSRITFLVAMALAAFIAGWRKTVWIIKVPAAFLLSLQFLYLVTRTIDLMYLSSNPIAMLEATAFALCGLGIVLSPVVVWLHNWAFTEPTAIGFLAISLGLLCLPGLSISTAPLEYPDVQGAALLFVAGAENQKILMSVITNPLNPAFSSPGYEAPAQEDFTIQNLGKQTIRWTLLVMGDARLQIGQSTEFHHSTGSVFHEVAVSSVTIPASSANSVQAIPPFIPPEHQQLFSGTLASGATATIGGYSQAPFSSSTIDRTAVSLPYYGEGDVRLVDTKTKASIRAALHMMPTIQTSTYFTVNITGGQLGPLESVTASNPNQAPEGDNSAGLDWISHQGIAVTYATVDQDSVDANNNVLFVFAILLGAAVAGLLASLQSLIHILSARKQPDAQANHQRDTAGARE
jgi:hypothetical protein